MKEYIKTFNLYKFNEILFEKLQIACSDIVLDEEQNKITLYLLSKCGAIELEVPTVILNLNLEEYIMDLINIIKNSSPYIEYLMDKNYGKFTKSDLFNQLNNEIIIPTQRALGPSYSNNLRDRVGYPAQQIFITSIKDCEDNNKLDIESIRAEIPACDEFYIYASFPKALGELRLHEAVGAIYESYCDNLDDWNTIVREEHGCYIKKPNTIGDIFRYFDFVGTGYEMCSLCEFEDI